jgi:hypothetical protein
MILRRFGVMVLGAASTMVVTAPRLAAQEATENVERRAPDPARAAVAAGDFLPNTLSARVGAAQVFAFGSGGYDVSRRGPLVDSAVEVAVWGPFALRAQTTYSNDTSRMRPSIGGRVQLLRQEAHGVDGSLTVFFKTEGFTEAEGEIETFASVGRRFEQVTAIGNLVYGQDPEGNERDGEVRASAFHQMGKLALGLDGRLRFAIGTQHGRAATVEPKLDFAGGPVATLAAGPVALFAEAGPSAFALAGGPTHFGLAAIGGLGAAF